MRLVGREKLKQFSASHTDARDWISGWVAEVEIASWKMPQDVKDRYRIVSFLEQNKVIFNVKGNRYRLEVRIAYKSGVVTVDWIGTHAEYSKRYR
jgi:mRNA interferase HigB